MNLARAPRKGNEPTGVRLLSVFIICLMACCHTVAQPAMGRYRTDFSYSPADFADTIGIDWQGGQVYVPVTVNGKQYRFLLDTGASQAVVFTDTPMSGCSHVGSIISHDATGRADTASMVMLPTVQLGGLHLYGLRATVQKRQLRSQSSPDGIIGFDLVNGGLSMKIDVPSRQLILTNRKNHFAVAKDGKAIVMKYRKNFHVPYLDIIPFGSYRERVLFDTGSRQFFSMNKQHFDDAFEAETTKSGKLMTADFVVEGKSFGRHAIGHYGVEPYGEVAFLQLNALRLSDCTFSNLHCLTTQGLSHLGAPILSYGAVTFIPARRLFIFQPSDENSYSPISVGNRQLEIAFVADANGCPQVGLIWEQGEPWRKGLREGDVIEQIDGRPVHSLAQFIGWPFMREREYSFQLRSKDGRRREVRWTRLP